MHGNQKGTDGERERETARDEFERDSPWVNTTEVADPLGGEAMTVNNYFVQNPHMIMGRLERSGTMRTQGELNVKLAKDADLGKLLDKAVGKLPRDVAPDLGKKVIADSLERHKTMSEALHIALAGHEPGHVEFNDKRELTQIAERETPSAATRRSAVTNRSTSSAMTVMLRRWVPRLRRAVAGRPWPEPEP